MTTTTKTIRDLKTEKAVLAATIRRYRAIRRDKTRQSDEKDLAQCKAKYAGREYRLLHIADCMMRGRSYRQIEPIVSEQNKLWTDDWSRINKIMREHGYQGE